MQHDIRKQIRGRRVSHGLSRRGLLLAFAGLMGSAAPVIARDFWGAASAGMPTDFIFGYGTLINEPSRSATQGRRVPGVPARISSRFGYVRSHVARAEGRSGVGFTALGLRRPGPGEEASSINGVVFPVEGAAEIAAFDRREGGYDRVEVSAGLIEAAGWQGLPRGGRVWIYVPRGAEDLAGSNLPFADADHPVLQSYLDVVLQGALAEGAAFARELVETTFDWSPFWLDDRPTPRRPWAGTAEAGAIDRLLATTEPAARQFGNRLYPELYAARHLTGRPEPAVPEGVK